MLSDNKIKKIIDILKHDGVGVMPTDTLYGLVGSAFSEKAIERIYKIKKRSKDKKSIILISSINDLKKFGIEVDRELGSILKKYWPGKTSIVLNDIAFRFPAKQSVIEILKQTGPLVAPSANVEEEKPAENVTEAREYFGDSVDFYLSGGSLRSQPSTLIKVNENGGIVVLRGKL